MEDSLGSLVMAPFSCLFSSFYCGFGLMWVVIMMLSMVGLVFWVFMLVDVIRRDEEKFPEGSKDQKVLWLLIVLLTSWIGALIYYIMVYKKVGAAK
ncbi:DUF2516 family protein [Candidatus Dojkabacteria bacterium]|nr:DUF2516 family protein [Candidatus Dojkabacteria bacterium]